MADGELDWPSLDRGLARHFSKVLHGASGFPRPPRRVVPPLRIPPPPRPRVVSTVPGLGTSRSSCIFALALDRVAPQADPCPRRESMDTKEDMERVVLGAVYSALQASSTLRVGRSHVARIREVRERLLQVESSLVDRALLRLEEQGALDLHPAQEGEVAPRHDGITVPSRGVLVHVSLRPAGRRRLPGNGSPRAAG